MTKGQRLDKLLTHIAKLKPKMIYQVLLGDEIVAEYDDFAEANEYFEQLVEQKEKAKTKTEQQEQWDNFVANLPRSWRLWEHPDKNNPTKELCYETMPRNFAARITLTKDSKFELYLLWNDDKEEWDYLDNLWAALARVEEERGKKDG